MNTVEALKELYKSFGGKLTDTYDDIADGIPVGNYSVIPDCFAALAEIAGGSIELPVVTQADAGDVLTVGEDGKWTNEEPAKELPTVTASDNGSVLSVVDGAWAKAEPLIKKTTISGTTDNYGMIKNQLNKKILVGFRPLYDMGTTGHQVNYQYITPVGASDPYINFIFHTVNNGLVTGVVANRAVSLEVYYIDLA